MMLWKRLFGIAFAGTNTVEKNATLELKTGATLKMQDANLTPSARVVTTTATALSLTATEHGERILLVNTNSTVANTFTLPTATGSGIKYTIINNIAQTQGSVVIAANGTTQTISGLAIGGHATTTTGGGAFLTSATSDKITFNRTTSGGLGQDVVEAWDTAANVFTVRVIFNGNGTLATPFSAT